ncbi:hypothetical protein [Hymenobacter wooponensis]|uniref:Uncharacterized protein n=1 Tax=Hymenobacter wooponensis TaxID=1525360 RepID=A0A4Z0MKK5_9BACT|nr:hypothetical protein [Hymenobacter wooponensis]TGD80303.1 hypothetical protein EU557_10690 [Hymenobacter wooponensis]
MKVIDILNKLEEGGHLTSLYQAGIINLKAFSQRDIYLRWQTLRASLRYAQDNAGAVRQVAEEMEVSVPSVYRAIVGMEQQAA